MLCGRWGLTRPASNDDVTISKYVNIAVVWTFNACCCKNVYGGALEELSVVLLSDECSSSAPVEFVLLFLEDDKRGQYCQ